MNPAATDRDHVMEVIEQAQARIAAEGVATPAAETPVEAARMAAELRQALAWMRQVEPRLADEVEDLEPGAEYISRHPIVSLVQTAIDEAEEEGTRSRAAAFGEGGEAAARAAGPNVVDLVGNALKFLFVPKPPFPHHKKLQDFRFELPDECTVALVADWGTGLAGAVEVLKRIAEARPRHMVHLGDIYSSGTEEEVQRHFIGPIEEHGPTECRFWALNGNHEMVSKGHGYFKKVLPFCGQPASYFSLGNRHWRLVGLDTAYDDSRLRPPQLEWVAHLLAEPPGPRNILMTHHQVFSPIDGRPGRNDMDIHLGPLAEPGNVFAWFWGHEHNCIIYDRDPARGGMRARCIGHGGKDTKLPDFGKTRSDYTGPPVLKGWTLGRPGDARRGLNGFALLEFDGPRLDVSYVAEDGQVFFRETWRADE